MFLFVKKFREEIGTQRGRKLRTSERRKSQYPLSLCVCDFAAVSIPLLTSSCWSPAGMLVPVSSEQSLYDAPAAASVPWKTSDDLLFTARKSKKVMFKTVTCPYPLLPIGWMKEEEKRMCVCSIRLLFTSDVSIIKKIEEKWPDPLLLLPSTSSPDLNPHFFPLLCVHFIHNLISSRHLSFLEHNTLCKEW